MTVRPVRDAAEFSSDGLSTLLHYQLLKQRLGLEIARLQDEQHPTCQAVVAIGHRAFFRGEGEIVDALIVREPGTAVELFDLGVFENRDAVLVSSGHGGSLFLRGRGTHLLYTVPKLTPKPKRRATSLACGAVFILDLHLVSADRQSPCHQLQQNIVALSPSTNHQVFPCRLTIGLSGASLRAYRDGIFSVSRTDPRLKPTGDLGHWRYFAEILAFARLRPTSVVWCEYYIISICSVHSSVNLLPHFVRMMLFLWHKNARQSRNRVSSRNFGAAASSFGLSG